MSNRLEFPEGNVRYGIPDLRDYDANGNRATANGANDTTGSGNQLRFDGTYYYLYDAEGNCTAKFEYTGTGTYSGNTIPTDEAEDVTKYTWDNRDRLTEVDHYQTYGENATADQVVNYVYDYANRLVKETVHTFNSQGTETGTQQRAFAYYDNQVVLQFQGTGTGAMSRLNMKDRYLWNPQAVDQLFADEKMGTMSYIQPGEPPVVVLRSHENVWTLTDQEDSIRDLAVVNAGTTTIADHRVYDSFGNLTWETPNAAVDCIFGYTGRMFDEATGLQNNLNRWYDSSTGRWLSEDPAGLLPDVNPYRYVGNNPMTNTDPSGLWAQGDLMSPARRPTANLLDSDLDPNRPLVDPISAGGFNFGLQLPTGPINTDISGFLQWPSYTLPLIVPENPTLPAGGFVGLCNFPLSPTIPSMEAVLSGNFLRRQTPAEQVDDILGILRTGDGNWSGGSLVSQCDVRSMRRCRACSR